jgi:ketosteroid isomerase-like protein
MSKGDPNEQLRRALAELFETGTRHVVVEQTRKLVARAGEVLRRNHKTAG